MIKMQGARFILLPNDNVKIALLFNQSIKSSFSIYTAAGKKKGTRSEFLALFLIP